MATNNRINASSAGLQALSSSGYSGRTLTGTSNQISVSNGDGTAGNPTASLTSTIQVSGISFDSGSNTLSTYATGTFSPTISNSTTPPTVTYTTQLGRYTQIGNRVLGNIYLKLNTYAAGTGNVTLSGLPITSVNVTNYLNIQSINLDTVTFGVSVTYYVGSIPPSSTNMQLLGIRSGAGTLQLDAAGPANNSIFNVSFSYEV